MKADLHVHTDCSDGSMSPGAIISYAARIHLDALSITDHDTMIGYDAIHEDAKIRGIDLIPGVELSTRDEITKRPVHLLVYYPNVTEELNELFSKMAENRMQASEETIEKLQKYFPIERETVFEFAKSSGTIFRIHIMRALIEMGYAQEYFGCLYEHYLSQQKGSCYTPVQYTEMTKAALVARRTGGVVVLAHPNVYGSYDAGERLAKAGLIDGIESAYPRFQNGEKSRSLKLINDYQLIATGGTDFHGMYTAKANKLATCCTSAHALNCIADLAHHRKHEQQKILFDENT